MSMTAAFRRLSDPDAARLAREPGLLNAYLAAQTPLEGFGAFADFDADKAWHAIHFLLTGTAWGGEAPLGFILHGGARVGADDSGYGPARVFMAHEVRDIADELDALPGSDLAGRFEPVALAAARIYPELWSRPPSGHDALGDVLEHYEGLRAFVSEAAENGQALLVTLA